MTISVNAKTYSADGWEKDAVRYQGPNHTGSVLDRIFLKKTDAKSGQTYSGNMSYNVALKRTSVLTGAKTPTGVASVNFGFVLPVGLSDADRDAIAADMGAFIASAAFKAMLKTGQTNG